MMLSCRNWLKLSLKYKITDKKKNIIILKAGCLVIAHYSLIYNNRKPTAELLACSITVVTLRNS